MLQRATIPNARKRGFTLMEMSVIITLIALFAAMIVPALAHWRAGDEYRAFPGKLIRLIGQAKLDAISSHTSRSIGYDETTGEFRLFWQDAQSSQEQEGGRVAMPDGVTMGRLVYLNSDTAPQDWRITFYPDGTAEKAGLELRDQDSYISVSVDAAGHSTLTHDALPEADTQRWQAGDNEVRQ